MMRYNFRPNLTDHAQVQILVRPFFNSSEQDFIFVLNKLQTFTYANIEDDERRILLKFTKGHSRESFEWGRLQLHRRPLGFVGVARISSDPAMQAKDYAKIETRFGNLISQYDSYLFDSRCIIIGPEDPQIPVMRKDMIYIPDTDQGVSKSLVDSINDFVTSIYVILESKRVEKISENFERMVLPTAPNESDSGQADMDSRFMKRKCLGRNRKILADLCLLSGFYQEALYHYTNSVEHLRNIGDTLWMGSGLEGMCSASVIMYAGDRILGGKNSELVIPKSNVNSSIVMDSNEEAKLKSMAPLNDGEIIGKYSECLSCMKKFTTGPVELEAHFKFIRILLGMKKVIEVCQVIQSLLVLPLSFNDNEKIDFSQVLASIHEQLHLKRKAAFYRRRAALYCIHQQAATKGGLAHAMVMLKRVAETHNVSVDHVTNDEKERGIVNGWPSVQTRVLLDMLHISRRLGNKLDTVRILCFVLEKYVNQLSNSESTELIDLLEEFSDDMEPLSNESRDGEEVVQLIRSLPIIRDFKPKQLARHLQPIKLSGTQTSGPFIFSSLYKTPKKEKEDIIWVCGDVSEVAMIVDNPLPAEIKVNNMTLITEGIEFEAHPATLALPAQSGSFPFMLLGTPKQPGRLCITGYKVEVFGIENLVNLPNPITVEVTPVLPLLRLSSTLPRASNSNTLNTEDEHYQTLFTAANLYQGHSCSGKLTLENNGKVDIEAISVKLKKPREQTVVFEKSQLEQQLPISPGDSATLDVEIMPSEAWKLHCQSEKVETALIVRYSGKKEEVDKVEDYEREICWVTYVKVMPSLQLSKFELNEIEGHSSCSTLTCEATNMTSIPMKVTSLLNPVNDVSIISGCPAQFETDLHPKKSADIVIHIPRCKIEPPKHNRKTMETIYEEFLKNSIILKWRLSDTNYNGVTYISNQLKITPNDVAHILKPKHLNIVVSANNNKLSEGEEIEVQNCELINLNITLTNSHEQNLENLVLNINPHQDSQFDANRIRELVTCTGILNKGVKKLSPGESFEHSCALLFMYNGKFVVDISCAPESQIGSGSGRRRAFAMLDQEPQSPKSPTLMLPYSPKTVRQKLRSHEANFWGQTFRLNVL